MQEKPLYRSFRSLLRRNMYRLFRFWSEQTLQYCALTNEPQRIEDNGSRFARNTVDSLTTIRELKEHNVECYFEKENIWTFDGKGELLLTIMSSLAQEESRSISENCTWGQRKRFADGKVTVPFQRFLGYDRGPDGNLVVNQEQAKTVRLIYSMFLKGSTPYGIATYLTQAGIPSPSGKPKWSAGAVRSILSNEKYKGDALLQKSFTVDYLTKKKKVNEGEIPQYYVEGNHEAIIEPTVFDMVQRELAKRGKGRNRHSGVHIFSGKIKCGECGSWYGSKVWHSNDKYRRVIWQCNHKFDGECQCKTPHLTDEEIKAVFLAAYNKLLICKETVIQECRTVISDLTDTTELTAGYDRLLHETTMFSEMLNQCIYENARVALDQEEYQKRYEELTQRYEAARSQLEIVDEAIKTKQAKRADLEIFLKNLQETSVIQEFDDNLWHSLVEFITVYNADDIRVTFKNGIEIQA